MAFDYHPDVLIASALPWFFYYLRQKRFIICGFVLIFILIGKENASLLMLFVTLGLMWDVRKDRQSLLVLCGYFLFCLLYAFLILYVVMPALDKNSGQNVYGGLYRYTDWGYSFAEILKNILSHPLKALQVLVNHDNKIEFFQCLLLSGALIGMGKPNYLFMTFPLIAQKMFSYDTSLWGIGFQYNVLFAPIVLIACFLTISKLPKQWLKSIAAVIALLLVLRASYYTMQKPLTWIRRENIAFYSHTHYRQTNFSATDAKKMMTIIPENASVCASSCFCPHLCFRDTIYVFPHERMLETEYVLVTQEFPEQDLSVFGEGYDTVAAARNLTLLRKTR